MKKNALFTLLVAVFGLTRPADALTKVQVRAWWSASARYFPPGTLASRHIDLNDDAQLRAVTPLMTSMAARIELDDVGTRRQWPALRAAMERTRESADRKADILSREAENGSEPALRELEALGSVYQGRIRETADSARSRWTEKRMQAAAAVLAPKKAEEPVYNGSENARFKQQARLLQAFAKERGSSGPALEIWEDALRAQRRMTVKRAQDEPGSPGYFLVEEAQWLQGDYYEKRAWTPRSLIQAFRWHLKAARAGFPKSIEAVRRLTGIPGWNPPGVVSFTDEALRAKAKVFTDGLMWVQGTMADGRPLIHWSQGYFKYELSNRCEELRKEGASEEQVEVFASAAEANMKNVEWGKAVLD